MRWNSKGTLLAVVATLALLIGGLLVVPGCGDLYVFDPGAGAAGGTGTGEPTGPLEVSIDTFIQDYQISSAAADAKYSGKTVTITGATVTEKGPDYITLNDFVKVEPTSASVIAGLAIGDTVKVSGKVGDYSFEEGIVPITEATVTSG